MNIPPRKQENYYYLIHYIFNQSPILRTQNTFFSYLVVCVGENTQPNKMREKSGGASAGAAPPWEAKPPLTS